jgi:hypothetical protein
MKTRRTLWVLVAGLFVAECVYRLEASGMDALTKPRSAMHTFVARADFDVPPEWSPEVINGRDFWNVFHTYYRGAYRTFDYDSDAYIFAPDVLMTADKASEHLKRLSKIPAFTDTALALIMYRGWSKGPDGSNSLVLPRVPKGLANRPLFLDVQDCVRLGTTPKNVLLEDFKSDRKVLDEWRRDNPNFKGFISGLEWLGDISQCKVNLDALTGRFDDPNHWALKKLKKSKGELMAIPDAQYDRLIQTWCPPVTAEDRYRLGVAKKYVERLAEICFGDPSLLVYGDGHVVSYHLVAKWGAGVVWMETSRPWQMWQNQMISARGAARQFNRPWMWYVASYGNGYDNKGKYIAGGEYRSYAQSETFAPFHGLTLSSVKRAFYTSYFSGANYMEREGARTAFLTFPFDTATLSKQGNDYIEFYNFTRANPGRGVPYTPVALLSPWNKLSERGGKSNATPGGAMHHAFLCSIYRMFPDEYLTSKYPGYQHVVMGQENKDSEDPIQRKEGHEWCFSNNPYGDVFDQLTPDFDDKSDFKRVINGYKVAILLDEFTKDAEMVGILTDYVKKGGTLVVNTRQLNELFPKEFTGVVLTGETVERNGYAFDRVSLAGARLLKEEAGMPVFTCNGYGKGVVIVTTPRYMIPDNKDYFGQFRDAKSGKLIFPYIRELLDGICGESLPIKVTGDIQFGLNKTKTGWWIYLLNNKGVYRLYGDPEKFDPNRTATVTVDVSRLNPKTVRELFSKQNVSVNNGKVTLTVGPGDLKCLRVDCQDGSEASLKQENVVLDRRPEKTDTLQPKTSR